MKASFASTRNEGSRNPPRTLTPKKYTPKIDDDIWTDLQRIKGKKWKLKNWYLLFFIYLKLITYNNVLSMELVNQKNKNIRVFLCLVNLCFTSSNRKIYRSDFQRAF